MWFIIILLVFTYLLIVPFLKKGLVAKHFSSQIGWHLDILSKWRTKCQIGRRSPDWRTFVLYGLRGWGSFSWADNCKCMWRQSHTDISNQFSACILTSKFQPQIKTFRSNNYQIRGQNGKMVWRTKSKLEDLEDKVAQRRISFRLDHNHKIYAPKLK